MGDSSLGSDSRHLVTYRAGEYIFREGDAGAEMYIVRQGEVEILMLDRESQRRLAKLERGDFFGEMSLLEDLPRNASARALTDAELVCVDRRTFDRMLRDNPEIAVRIMRKLSRRLREADRRLRRGTEEFESRVKGTFEGPQGLAVRLLHRESRCEFPLDKSEVIVGRADPVTGVRPSVDLTGVDGERSSSRRHARFFEREGELLLVEEIGTTNGTFVNGEQLESGVPVPVRPGDVLRFGLVELELIEG